MGMGAAKEYYDAITVIEAQENLVKMSIADYPNATKEGRKKLHRGMHRLASPKHLQKEVSFEEFRRNVKRGK